MISLRKALELQFWWYHVVEVERVTYLLQSTQTCIDLLSVYLGVNVVAVVDVNCPCSFRADYDVLGWFHELLKHESDEQLCGEIHCTDKISLVQLRFDSSDITCPYSYSKYTHICKE